MSFPRAKINRFNEIQSCTPSPAEYNPKVKGHVVGAVLSTTDRFIEHKSPAVSDTTSIHSLNSTTCFRTPTLPKKKKQATPSITKVKCADIFNESEVSQEVLKEKMVECNNKDLYINELTEQIEDMKVQLNKLKMQKNNLEVEQQKFENLLIQIKEEHKDEIENLNAKHVENLEVMQEEIKLVQYKLELATKECDQLKSQDLEDKYKKLINHIGENHELELENLHLDYKNEQMVLKGNIVKLNNEMALVRSEWNKLRSENRRDIEDILQHIHKFQKLNNALIKACNEEICVKEEIISKEREACIKLENDIKHLSEIQESEMKNLKAKHNTEIEDIEYEMLKTITELQNKLDREKKSLETMYKSKIANLENSHKEKIFKLENRMELQIKQIESDCKEANKLTEAQLQEKYNCVENEWKIKLETQAHHFEKLLQDHKDMNEEKEYLIEEMNKKLRDVENTWKVKLEKQVDESEDILKECQAISEYNIIQCELEKNDVKRKLSEAVSELEREKESRSKCVCSEGEINTLYAQLKLNYDETISKLEYAREELIKAKEHHNSEVQQMLNEKHTFEITVTKTRETVEALTKRLFDSDRDVIQLKSELEACEMEKLKAEDKCNRLTTELETITKLYEDMELQNESNLKQAENKIQTLEKELLQKVDEYKKKIKDSITQSTSEMQRKSQELDEVKEQLHQQQTLNFEAQNLVSNVSVELEQYEARDAELERDVSTLRNDLDAATRKIKEMRESNNELREQLQEQTTYNTKLEISIKEANSKNQEIQLLLKQVNHLQEKSDSYYHYCEYYKCKANEYEKEIEDLNIIQKNYIDQSGKYDELLQRYEELLARNSELAKTIIEMDSLIGPFREQLEAYEMERTALLNQKHDAENEARIMGMKYAQILGHQNQKQKIKHLIDLKRKNYEILESKAQIEQKVRAQAKTIDKLKKEIGLLTKNPKRQSNVDKENINNSSVTLNSSDHVQSPLRNRN